MCQILERCERMVTVPGIHVLYRQRSGSITKTQNAKNLIDYLLAINAVEEYGMEHSPDVVSSENLRSFQEKHARILSNRYARLIYHPHMPGSFSQIRKDILFCWKRIDGISCLFHTRIMRFLFQYAPWLIIPSKAAWRFGKFLASKVIYR